MAQITPWLLVSPLLTTVLGIVFMNDQVGPRLWIGAAMVLSGVGVVGTRKLAGAGPERGAEAVDVAS